MIIIIGAFMRIGNYIATPIMKLLQKTPYQGSFCSIHAATSPEIDKTEGGQYLVHCRSHPVSEAAMNNEAAIKLWMISEKLTGLAQ